MTSVFVFKLSQKPAHVAAISPDIGIIFPVARDVKSFELMTANNQKFSQKNFYRHWTLLFFGFTHCSNVCPASLEMLKRTYSKLEQQYPNLQVVFISLDPERDSPQALLRYTQTFNPKFIGVTGKIQELHKLQSELGIYATRVDSTNSQDYQLQHTSSILLINPQGQWAGLFKFGLTPDQFATAFERALA